MNKKIWFIVTLIFFLFLVLLYLRETNKTQDSNFGNVAIECVLDYKPEEPGCQFDIHETTPYKAIRYYGYLVRESNERWNYGYGDNTHTEIIRKDEKELLDIYKKNSKDISSTLEPPRLGYSYQQDSGFGKEETKYYSYYSYSFTFHSKLRNIDEQEIKAVMSTLEKEYSKKGFRMKLEGVY